MYQQQQQMAIEHLSNTVYEASTECHLCHKKFHAFRRKHRCKACGKAVCGNCGRTHKYLPLSSLVRYTNEPVRVCDRCVSDQNAEMHERRRMADLERLRARQAAIEEEEQRQLQAEQRRQQQEEEEKKKREETRRLLIQRQLEEKHFGPRRNRRLLKRSQSLPSMSNSNGDINNTTNSTKIPLHPKQVMLFIYPPQERAKSIGNRHLLSSQETMHKQQEYTNGVVATATVASSNDTGGSIGMDEIITQLAMIQVKEAEECAICLEFMEVGNAIFTTACRHSFHWGCLKEIQRSDVSNADKCPACRAIMEEMQVKKQCDHPRVRTGHRFCRDCGQAVTEADVKSRPNESSGTTSTPSQQQQQQTPAPPTSYRANAQGALVRCPQCQIQMRVLPHMYNMRVACPSGHMFLVQVAGHGSNSHRGTNSSSNTGGYGRVGSNAGGTGGPVPRTGNINAGYPGYYRSTNSYSEL